ncbi:hypothetical protein KC19_VG313200 [Ceratodon purpureus]|uniref:Uncharacterized protein n=1 Tax=Ceratodon purpureus TaxID=3225 RepID=A0A8T0HWJ7_CERPU|nr:hypothetical protein KC19_VG313200 [Ceratodon purpureus]
MCTTRWGPRVGGVYRYARPGHRESPRQCYRIEKLYQAVYQRPIGKQRAFGLGFARGLLAKKLGFAVDWASFAAKQCSRGKKPFNSFQENKRKCRRGDGWWPANEVKSFNIDENTLEGAVDDWDINIKPATLDRSKIRGYNLKHALPGFPPSGLLPGHRDVNNSRHNQTPTMLYAQRISFHHRQRQARGPFGRASTY